MIYTITVTDSLGATANYSFEVVENPTAPAIPDYTEVLNVSGGIVFGADVAVVDAIAVSGGIEFSADVTVSTLETIEVSGAIVFSADVEVTDDGGGGGGESKNVLSINTTGDFITLVGNDFDWPSGTVVRWTTTGTLPPTDPQIVEGENYILIKYIDPQYEMYREFDNAFVDFFPGGSGTHTLTEQ